MYNALVNNVYLLNAKYLSDVFKAIVNNEYLLYAQYLSDVSKAIVKNLYLVIIMFKVATSAGGFVKTLLANSIVSKAVIYNGNFSKTLHLPSTVSKTRLLRLQLPLPGQRQEEQEDQGGEDEKRSDATSHLCHRWTTTKLCSTFAMERGSSSTIVPEPPGSRTIAMCAVGMRSRRPTIVTRHYPVIL